MHRYDQFHNVDDKFVNAEAGFVEQDAGYHKNKIVLLVSGTFLLFSLFLIYNAWQRYEEASLHQFRLAESSVNGAVSEIVLQISNLKRAVKLFGEREHKLLSSIANGDAPYVSYDLLTARVKATFPESFAVTVANTMGDLYVDDFDGIIEEVCRNDIKLYGKHHHPPSIVIHPNPLAYHFDVMVPVELPSKKNVIFFISFRPSLLSRFLESSQLFQNRLIALHQKRKGLVELHSNGSRDTLQEGEFHLSAEQLARVSHRKGINGTYWELVNLPDDDAILSYSVRIWSTSALFLVTILLFCVYLLRQILQSNTKIIEQNNALTRIAYDLQRNKQRMERAQKATRMGYWDLNLATDEMHFSSSAAELLGIENDKQFTQYLLKKLILREDLHKVSFALASSIVRRRSGNVEFRILQKNGGELRILQASAELTTDSLGNPIYMFGILQDITERKQAGEAAQRALLDKVKAENDKTHAQQANSAKSAFIANMSHEIRTPLTAIIGFGDSLLSRDQTPDEHLNATKAIISSGEHLLNLINDILDVSKIEAGKLEVERVDVPLIKLTQEVEYIIGSEARRKGLDFGVNLIWPIPPIIKSDYMRLKQILLNLCSNAIKFTQKGHVIINVNFSIAEKRLNVSVVDTGIGIKQENLNKVFDSFTQADSSTTRKYGGTGLGLTLCRQLAHMLGGELTVSSQPGIGSEFTLGLTMPGVQQSDLAYSDSRLQHERVEATVQTKRTLLEGCVLLAEDNHLNQKLLTMYLIKMGLKVILAENGKQAVEKAMESNVDLVFMDMHMPVMDGLVATRVLRQKLFNKPIIALTANAWKEDKDKCIKAGCVDFVTKPVKEDYLYNVVNTHLGRVLLPELPAPITTTLQHEETGTYSLLAKFVESLTVIRQELVSAHLTSDWGNFRTLLLNLKQGGSECGYPVLVEMATKIDLRMQNKDYTDVDILIQSLYNVIEQIARGWDDTNNKHAEINA